MVADVLNIVDTQNMSLMVTTEQTLNKLPRVSEPEN